MTTRQVKVTYHNDNLLHVYYIEFVDFKEVLQAETRGYVVVSKAIEDWIYKGIKPEWDYS